MTITFQQIELALQGRGVEARLVLYDDRLCAVLSLLDPEIDGASGWFVEAAFGQLHDPSNPTFPELTSAEAWVISKLAAHRSRHA
jgi:hypothetical protein